MPIVFVPITKDNFNFLKVIHPEPIWFGFKDDLGMIFSTIIKHSYRHFKKEKYVLHKPPKDKKGKPKIVKPDEVIVNRNKYRHDLEINYDLMRFSRNKRISMNCIRAINNKINQMIQDKLDEYIMIEKYKDDKNEIRALIYEFLSKYSLSDDNKRVATLERQNRRKRKKTMKQNG